MNMPAAVWMARTSRMPTRWDAGLSGWMPSGRPIIHDRTAAFSSPSATISGLGSGDSARSSVRPSGADRVSGKDWGLASLVEDVRLVVSELVGNVVHHSVPDGCRTRPGAPRRVDVSLRKWPKWLFLAVADEDSSPPVSPIGEMFSPDVVGSLPEAVLPDSGRGLLIVQRLADALWWSPEEDGGKTVHVRFDLDGGCADGSP